MPTDITASDKGTVVRIGEKSTHKFSLIPKIRFVPEPPADALKEQIGNPSQLSVSFKILGQQTNLPRTIPCLLWWVVRRSGEDKVTRIEDIGPTSASVKWTPDRFEILVDGKTPVLSLIGARLFGKGKVGYRFVPDFPHAATVESPTFIDFDNDLALDVKMDGDLRLGSRATFTPAIAPVFRNALVRVELHGDTGGKLYDDSTLLFDKTWKGGDVDAWEWNVGFQGRRTLALPTEPHGDTIGYAYRLVISENGEPGTWATASEDHTKFSSIRKPILESFALQRSAVYAANSLYAAGKLTGFAPGTEVPIDIALVHKFQLGQDPLPEFSKVRTSLNADGSFSALSSLKIIAPWQHHVDQEEVFALMRLPLQGPYVPIARAVDFNEDQNPGFTGAMMEMKSRAEWICSREATEDTFGITLEQKLDSPLVKRVLYKGGTEQPAAQAKFRAILAGEATVRRGDCEVQVCRAIERALIYLCYPTKADGTVGVSGTLDHGVNFGLALFVRHRSPEPLCDEHGTVIPDAKLLFASTGNDATVAGIKRFPTIVVDKSVLGYLLTTISGTPRTHEVYLGGVDAAVENLDRIDPLTVMDAPTLIARFKDLAVAACHEVLEREKVRIDPRWLAAIALQETGGVPRPKYEHHILYQYYTRAAPRPNPGDVHAGQLRNIMECRFYSTRFGLCHVIGSKYASIPALGFESARSLFMASERDQIRAAAYHLATGGDPVRAIVQSFELKSADSLKPLAAHYGAANQAYRGSLFDHASNVKALWGDVQAHL